ncbi:hypothetical protein [Sediminibacillus sp. JSM 1682029]|uniref:hypothetical protein n=1 Tax=Sediminibacillus sp. JSM 1682029 TaxID=3229857 RepID=UPI0035262A3F
MADNEKLKVNYEMQDVLNFTADEAAVQTKQLLQQLGHAKAANKAYAARLKQQVEENETIEKENKELRKKIKELQNSAE